MRKLSTYDGVSRLNHWIIAIVMIGMLAFGLYLAYGGLTREERGPLMDVHKSIGVLVLLFGTWRVLWRIIQGFPASASEMPGWQETASRLAHWGLLAGVILMPLSGIVASVFRGRAVDVFGRVTIPAQTEITWLAELGSTVHQFAGYGLVALVVIHIVAALKHHFVNADPTLIRMLRGQSQTDPSS